MKYNLVTVLGPTAVGKTKLSARLAAKFNGEVISADSRQVYKKLNIGTGKDIEDYTVNGKTVAYHLIDIAEPVEEFNLFAFKEAFNATYKKISEAGKMPILAGGTGLYLSSIIQNYELKRIIFNPDEIVELEKMSEAELREKLISMKGELHNTTDLLLKERIINALLLAQSGKEAPAYPHINSLTIGVNLERDETKKRITERLKKRLNEGMIEEVKALLDSGVSHERLDNFGLEYRYLSQYLKGELTKNDMYQKLNSAIHNFAKRQMTWFRKMEKEGVKIFWIKGASFEEAESVINKNYHAS